MAVGYTWEDRETKRVLRYIAEDPWNWKDYHKAVQISRFALHGLTHDIDVIVDLSRSSRLPAGALAHVRTFGRRITPAMTGRALVIGMDEALVTVLCGDSGMTRAQFGEQTLYFVKNEAEAQALLADWTAS